MPDFTRSIANVDSDRIIPARFLGRRSEPDHRDYLFHEDRFEADGRPRAGFIIDDLAYRGARILVAGANFGVGPARVCDRRDKIERI